MKILFDTNIILDVMLDREPFSEPAVQLLSLVEKSRIEGLLCATTITTIHYLSTKVMGAVSAKNKIKDLLNLFKIAAVNRSVLEDALRSKFTDFEDAVIYEAACYAKAEAIVTRDPKGFKLSKLPIYDSNEMLIAFQLLNSENN